MIGQGQHPPLGLTECPTGYIRCFASYIHQISLLDVEGKILFSVVACRLTTYLQRNQFINTLVQKKGLPVFPRCVKHTSRRR